MANPWTGSRVSPWTSARQDLVTKLIADGLSRSQVAEKVNLQTGSAFSRSAITRFCQRAGLSAPESPSVPKEAKPRKRKRKLALVSPPLAPELPLDKRERRLGLLDLTSNTCRWPLGEPGEETFCFCGADAARPSSYCRRHHQIAYRRAA